MYVCMCSVGWYCRNLGIGLLLCYFTYICKKKGFLDYVCDDDFFMNSLRWD